MQYIVAWDAEAHVMEKDNPRIGRFVLSIWMQSAFLTNLALLSFQPTADLPSLLFGKKNLNNKAWENVLYFLAKYIGLELVSNLFLGLFLLILPGHGYFAPQMLADCYPTTTQGQSKEFRLGIFKCFEQLKRNGQLPMSVMPRKSDFDEYRGERFVDHYGSRLSRIEMQNWFQVRKSSFSIV